MNFQTIWILKGILAKFMSEKAGLEKHCYLKYALIHLYFIWSYFVQLLIIVFPTSKHLHRPLRLARSKKN